MKTWAQFYPFVLAEVPGCPDPVVDHHLRLAARDFCNRSGAWIEWVDSFTTSGSINRWDYDLTGEQELVKITRALRTGEELAVKAGGALPPDWESGDSTRYDIQDTLVHLDDESFVVFPKPAAGDIIKCEMVFMPSLSATGVGDVLFANNAENIAIGALARMMMIPGKTWTNYKLAAEYKSQFESSLHSAANTAFQRTGRSARVVKKAPL
jgi:hypothetical protein